MASLFHRFALLGALAAIVSGLSSGACQPKASEEGPFEAPERLSKLGLFSRPLADLQPAPGVVPYELNSPAFQNYAEVSRVIRIPSDTPARYGESPTLELPVGTVVAQTLSYATGEQERSRQLLETRVLFHTRDGWLAVPYVWNEEQTEAELERIGGLLAVPPAARDTETRPQTHLVPDVNQCKECHRVRLSRVQPIGLRLAQLNRDVDYGEGPVNQLDHWIRLGILDSSTLPAVMPRYPLWNDPRSGSLDERARAWLEINCAHCHNPGGAANMSGLDLRFAQTDSKKYGIYKAPVAAGGGTGGRDWDIVPGRPELSVLLYRLESLTPGHMMPEIGRTVVDREGVALIREWIAQMSPPPPDQLPARTTSQSVRVQANPR